MNFFFVDLLVLAFCKCRTLTGTLSRTAALEALLLSAPAAVLVALDADASTATLAGSALLSCTAALEALHIAAFFFLNGDALALAFFVDLGTGIVFHW